MLIVQKRALNLLLLSCFCFFSPINQLQHAKKVLSDILGLVDFAIRQVNSALILPDQQVKFFGVLKLQIEEMLSILFIKMTSGLVLSNYSLPALQASKTDFLCTLQLAFFQSWATHIEVRP